MLIQIKSLEFHYNVNGFRLSVPELRIESGQCAAFVGPSGSGKTTLLKLLSGILTPHNGEISIGDNVLNRLTDAQKRSFRIRQAGFIFQDFRLVEHLNVQENILLPYRINQSLALTDSVKNKLIGLTDSMGISGKLNNMVHELSQGEQQRVAICRALLPAPTLLLADEPTGNLDPKNKIRIIDLLFEHAHKSKATLIVVTHDRALLDHFEKIIDFGTTWQS